MRSRSASGIAAACYQRLQSFKTGAQLGVLGADLGQRFFAKAGARGQLLHGVRKHGRQSVVLDALDVTVGVACNQPFCLPLKFMHCPRGNPA